MATATRPVPCAAHVPKPSNVAGLVDTLNSLSVPIGLLASNIAIIAALVSPAAGKPIALVKLANEGVVKLGVLSVAFVSKTFNPVPVLLVSALPMKIH
jgi:hypothetical protein